MNVWLLTFTLAALASSGVAFSPRCQKPTSRLVTSMLPSTRKGFCSSIINGCFSALVSSTVLVVSTPARADLDYSRIQDLLGSSLNDQQVYDPDSGKRPIYLTEPTAEFKENELKAAEFKRSQIQLKKQFLSLIDKLDKDPDDVKVIETDLDEMRKLVRQAGGLPLGITKEQVVKEVRRRKARKFWPTDLEIAYQDLLAEISYQQSPNTERDYENPF